MDPDPLYELIGQAMEEPKTPKETAEVKVDMAVRDAWLASGELSKLSLDPLALPFILKSEGHLWSIKLRIDEVISFIRTQQGDMPLPKSNLKVVSRG